MQSNNNQSFTDTTNEDSLNLSELANSIARKVLEEVDRRKKYAEREKRFFRDVVACSEIAKIFAAQENTISTMRIAS